MSEATKATHTPGPWYLSGYNVRFRHEDQLGNIHEGLVCYLSDSRRVAVEADANARLIAAAPELLSDAIESIDSIGEIIRWMEDTALPALGDDCDGGNCLLESLKLKRDETVSAISKARGESLTPTEGF